MSSSPNPTQQQSHIPTPFRAISRNNSNTSTASSSNKGDFSSTISTANSVTSGRSQLSKHQLLDHRQLLAACGSSTPIRSFQRATISSVVKTRAFDNNPVLQGLLNASPSSQNSSSQTPSPLSTPIFSRSRSLRMSGGPQRYQQSPSYYRTSSKTPELYSYTPSDSPSCSNISQAKILELSNEKTELKESLEFLECERQVLVDSVKDLKEVLSNERSQRRKEQEDLKMQIAESIAAKVRADSQLTHNVMEMNDLQVQIRKLSEELAAKERDIVTLRKTVKSLQDANKELIDINNELKLMLSEKLKYNGLVGTQNDEHSSQQVSDCLSIVTEMARLRLEVNEKESTIAKLNKHSSNNLINSDDMDNLNRFLDQTVECIKGWPDELASSSHVQNLMKTLLSSYQVDRDNLTANMENVHL